MSKSVLYTAGKATHDFFISGWYEQASSNDVVQNIRDVVVVRSDRAGLEVIIMIF